MSLLPVLEVETGANPTVSVIWLHGLGADGSDFEAVVPALKLSAVMPVRFIFPNAPQIPVTCNGGYVMPAWYDIITLQPGHREIDEAGLLQTRTAIRELIQREHQRGIPSHRIFIAGFSQGGAVAYLTGLTHPDPLAGIIALSTYIPSRNLISRDLSEANHQIPVFVGHGHDDDVVLPEMGQSAVAFLTELGLSPIVKTYALGHSVSIVEIRDIGNWLNTRIAELAMS